MIIVNGKKYRTLDDEITVNGVKVYEVWTNGEQVYPDEEAAPVAGNSSETCYIPNPFRYYETTTFDKVLTVTRREEIGVIYPDGSEGVMYETVTFDCNGFGCAIVDSHWWGPDGVNNPEGGKGTWKPGQNCTIPVFDCEHYSYYDADLQSTAHASKWTLYDGGPAYVLRLVRFYTFNDADHPNHIVAFKGNNYPVECLPRNYVTKEIYEDGRVNEKDPRFSMNMDARYFHHRAESTYIWNVPDDPPYDAITTLGDEANYLWSKSFTFNQEDLSNPWSWK